MTRDMSITPWRMRARCGPAHQAARSVYRQPQPPSLDYRVAPIGYSIRQIQVIGPGQVIGVEVVPPAPAATIVVGGADDAQVEAVAVHVPRSTLRAPPSSRFVSHAIPTAASEPFVSYASAQPRRRLSGFV